MSKDEKLLTEKQLLAMPAKDYMNETQLNFFSNRLREQYNEITANIEEVRKSLSETEFNADPSDLATQQEMQQFKLREIDRQNKLRKKIEEALVRIKHNEYGYCDETGEPIGIPRLLARPTATMSIQAKEIQEYHEKTEGKTREVDEE